MGRLAGTGWNFSCDFISAKDSRIKFRVNHLAERVQFLIHSCADRRDRLGQNRYVDSQSTFRLATLARFIFSFCFFHSGKKRWQPGRACIHSCTMDNPSVITASSVFPERPRCLVVCRRLTPPDTYYPGRCHCRVALFS